jgi:hypothetical protein
MNPFQPYVWTGCWTQWRRQSSCAEAFTLQVEREREREREGKRERESERERERERERGKEIAIERVFTSYHAHVTVDTFFLTNHSRALHAALVSLFFTHYSRSIFSYISVPLMSSSSPSKLHYLSPFISTNHHSLSLPVFPPISILSLSHAPCVSLLLFSLPPTPADVGAALIAIHARYRVNLVGRTGPGTTRSLSHSFYPPSHTPSPP